ncbi:hypothetical protein [Treponema pedis]|uniref:Lipoprotein n=1 Tax=Treponema pedis TaxID=409322 RepID=A0A7S6WNK0_9SPIR|nr:hypothetical protein [Treponema pedis]QOW60386.1 hypothetical protein IFE08_11275 [Treponema pedis]
MTKQRTSILITGISALLLTMFLTACPVTPAKPADEKKSEVTPESVLNSVFEVKWYGNDGYPNGNKHYYIYIGPDGTVYEAEKDNGAELKKPDISLLGGNAKVENNQFVQGGQKYPYTLKDGVLTVGEPRKSGSFGLEAVKVTSPTGQEIMAVQKNGAEAEKLQ